MTNTTAQTQLPTLQVAYACDFVQIRLEKAVESGNSSELKLILQEETALDINAMNSEGLSPFHKCIMGGDLDCLKLLVRHGADIKLATRDGWSPMHLATWKGHRKIILYLLTHNR